MKAFRRPGSHARPTRRAGTIADGQTYGLPVDYNRCVLRATKSSGQLCCSDSANDQLLIATIKSLFCARGEKAAAFFSDPATRQQIKLLEAGEAGFVGGEKVWADSLANSPIVQFRTAFAGLDVELINLGRDVLPYVTVMLRGANSTPGGKGELGLGAGLLGAWMFRGRSCAALALLARGLWFDKPIGLAGLSGRRRRAGNL
jgi:hypothetical protein